MTIFKGMEVIKMCWKCNKNKKIGEFYPDRSKKDGFSRPCKECKLKQAKEYFSNNKEARMTAHRQWVEKNKEKTVAYQKEYREKNKTKASLYEKNRTASDIQFRLTKMLRSRLRTAIKNGVKNGSAVKDLGCSINKLKQYLESKFQPGMSWENHGYYGWHIDHIIPLSKFDLTNREEYLKACHYSNLQPLWAVDNIKKSNKVEEI
jgi:hypothetical protein